MNKTDKCPNCGSTETRTQYITHDQGFLEETWTECKQCGELKHHWSYGCLFVKNWKDMSCPEIDTHKLDSFNEDDHNKSSGGIRDLIKMNRPKGKEDNDNE